MEHEIAVGVINIVEGLNLRMPRSPAQISLQLLHTVFPCPIKPPFSSLVRRDYQDNILEVVEVP